MNNSLPPPVIEPLYKQIQRLKDEVLASNLKIKAAPINTPPIHTPEEKMVQWIRSLTPAQLKKSYSTLEVIKLANLAGKYKKQPALQEVAQLLRKHGFEHRRSWATGTNNRRYWIFRG